MPRGLAGQTRKNSYDCYQQAEDEDDESSESQRIILDPHLKGKF
jgi:hypothetical protein